MKAVLGQVLYKIEWLKGQPKLIAVKVAGFSGKGGCYLIVETANGDRIKGQKAFAFSLTKWDAFEAEYRDVARDCAPHFPDFKSHLSGLECLRIMAKLRRLQLRIPGAKKERRHIMTTTTLEALQKLTGAELNRRVAARLGWMERAKEGWGWVSPKHGRVAPLPNWAGEMGAAMGLLEAMKGHDFYLRCEHYSYANEPVYGARFAVNSSLYADADTPAKAIAIAFLLAAGEG